MDYDFLLNTLSGKNWKKIGIKKRKGINIALFSLYSQRSFGIGDAIDLLLMIDWCKKTKHTLLQLLPLNETGLDFSPYSPISSFALDPMYLSLDNLRDVDKITVKNFLQLQKSNFHSYKRVNYQIKSIKIEILKKIFLEWTDKNSLSFKKYKEENSYWLSDYAKFKVLKVYFKGKRWVEWKNISQDRDSFLKEDLLFEEWIQWQLFEQFKMVKNYAEDNNILIMGDIPLLVAFDSVDVWTKKKYFKTDLVAGAPPDMYQRKGQRWNMPPYNWEEIANDNYIYIIQKLKYAENFYHLYRIDHVVGLFRIWTIDINEPLENEGLRGKFDPVDTRKWEEQGRTILSVMIDNIQMLACAEDLGTVPLECYKVLKELGIPGIEVQRWTKYWETTCDFKKPEDYREIAVVSISTHDMSNFASWWEYEAGTIEEDFFIQKCEEKGINFNLIKDKLFHLKYFGNYKRIKWKEEIENVEILEQILNKENCWEIIKIYKETYKEKHKFWQRLKLNIKEFKEEFCTELLYKTLQYANETSCIFNIQSILDVLLLDDKIREKVDILEFRINWPGTISEKNWSLILPLSLEELLNFSI